VVFDFGLHYYPTAPKEIAAFNLTMHNFFREASKFDHLLLAWRETSAQHYIAVGGHYGGGIPNKTCVDASTVADNGDPRFGITVAAAAASNISLVQDTKDLERNAAQFWVIPYREFTLQLNFLHGGAANDCSHFFHTPFVWMPIWQNIRSGIKQWWP